MYRKRLHVYKAVGYSIGVPTEGLFAEPATETIFDGDNFGSTFHSDFASATQSIIIAVNRLRWNRTPKIIELLVATMMRGVKVTIIITETGHQEADLQAMGINIIHYPDSTMNCAVVDKRIGWYGSVNFIGRSLPDTNVIRMQSPDFANALLDALAIP